MLTHQPSIIHTPREFISLYPRPPLLTSLETQWQTIAMAYLCQPAYERSEVCTPFHRIAIYTRSSVIEHKFDGTFKQESIQPEDIVVIPGNLGQSTRWVSSVEMIGIGLDASLFDYAIDDAINAKQPELVPQPPTRDPLVYQLGLALKTALEEDPTSSRLYAETAAAMLAVHLLQHYGQRKLEFRNYADGLPRFVLRQVIDYIHANLAQALGLADLAAIANLSPHYFTRLFKQSTGFTPHQFVLRCRVERAKTLLLSSQSSIAAIAQQVGFANQAHLNVHIKRALGVTPKTILEQRKNR